MANSTCFNYFKIRLYQKLLCTPFYGTKKPLSQTSPLCREQGFVGALSVCLVGGLVGAFCRCLVGRALSVPSFAGFCLVGALSAYLVGGLVGGFVVTKPSFETDKTSRTKPRTKQICDEKLCRLCRWAAFAGFALSEPCRRFFFYCFFPVRYRN